MAEAGIRLRNVPDYETNGSRVMSRSIRNDVEQRVGVLMKWVVQYCWRKVNIMELSISRVTMMCWRSEN